jgi:hypothetical protein
VGFPRIQKNKKLPLMRLNAEFEEFSGVDSVLKANRVR